MGHGPPETGSRVHGLTIKIVGAVILLTGILAAVVGPVEIYCFYLFSEGGPFHYEGFGVGSFMFANITTQIVGYYLIAAVGIPLGYGHLAARRWSRPLMLTLLWFWLLAGLPLMVVVCLMFIQAKDPSLQAFFVTLPFVFLIYPILPLLLVRFYQSRQVRDIFERAEPAQSWLESIPLGVRVLCTLLCLYIVALHIAILLRGPFPLFGVLLAGLPGISAIAVVALVLVGLTWGLMALKQWAWWGTLLVFGLLLVSSVATLSRYTFADILLILEFPRTEMDAFRNVPLESSHIMLMAAAPLVTTLALILYVKRHLRR